VQNTAIASGLTAGTYTVTVTDSKGCTDTEQVTITEPQSALLAAIGSVQNVNCKGDITGSATASATGGTAEYTYSWNTNPVQSTAMASGLTAGTYTVTVTDSKGCTDTEQITITEPQSVLTCSITQNKSVSANSLSDGEATVTPLGGNGGYSYLWDNGETTVKAVALNAGLHSVTVTDSKGCKTTCEIRISEPNVLSCSITQDSPAKCFGDSNGVATVTAIGGNGEYTYLWDNGKTTAQAIALNAGNHSVTVTDKLGYKTTCNVTIGQPSAVLSAIATTMNNNNCVGCNNGAINLTVSGGSTPYSYSWSNGATTEDIVNLIKGTYSVTITDNNGCTSNPSFEITESGIALVKTGVFSDTNNDGFAQVGEKINYTFAVTNRGNVTVTNVDITDLSMTLKDLIMTGNPIASLAPGATSSVTGVYTITQGDINTGKVTNSALAIGKDPKGNNVTDTSGTTVDNDTPTVTPLNNIIRIPSAACTSSTETRNLNDYLPANTPTNGTWTDISGTGHLVGSIVSPFGLAITPENNPYVFEYKIGEGTNSRSIRLLMSVDNSCFVEACRDIIVHNAFSPNGDGINEVFTIENIEDTCYIGNTVEIYNRWGVLVFETRGYDNVTKVFRGISEGRTTISQSSGLPTGTYFYILNYTSVVGGNTQTNKKSGYLYLTR
ncbi:hypothetical protein E0I26_16315, partial [Flavobacterium rhamnosiphilum]